MSVEVAKTFLQHGSCARARSVLFRVFQLDELHKNDPVRWLATSSGSLCLSILSFSSVKINQDHEELLCLISSFYDYTENRVLLITHQGKYYASQLEVLQAVIIYCLGGDTIPEFEKVFFLSFPQVRKYFRLDASDLSYTPPGEGITGHPPRKPPKRFSGGDEEGPSPLICPDSMIVSTLAFINFICALRRMHSDAEEEHTFDVSEEAFVDFVVMYHFKQIDDKTLARFDKNLQYLEKRFKPILDSIRNSNYLYQQALTEAERERERITSGRREGLLDYVPINRVSLPTLIKTLEERHLYREGAKIREALSGGSWKSYIAYQFGPNVSLAQLSNSFSGFRTKDLDFFLSDDLEYSYLISSPRVMSILLCRMSTRANPKELWWHVPTRLFLSNHTDLHFGHGYLNYIAHCMSPTIAKKCVKPDSPNLWLSLMILDRVRLCVVDPERLGELMAKKEDCWQIRALYMAICMDEEWLVTRAGALACATLDSTWTYLVDACDKSGYARVHHRDDSNRSCFPKLIEYLFREDSCQEATLLEFYLKRSGFDLPLNFQMQGRRTRLRPEIPLALGSASHSKASFELGEHVEFFNGDHVAPGCDATNLSIISDFIEANYKIRPKKVTRKRVEEVRKIVFSMDPIDDGFLIDTSSSEDDRALYYLTKFNEGIGAL